MKKNRLKLLTQMKNKSNSSGTKPKIQIRIYDIPNKPQSKLTSYKNFQKCCDDEGLIPDKKLFNMNRSLKIFTTNDSFSEKILYPNDGLSLMADLDVSPAIKINKYLIVRVDYLFREAKRESKTYLFDVKNINSTRILMECESSSSKVDELISLYDKLIKKEN